MSKAVKVVVIVFASLFAVGGLGYLGIMAFARSAYSQRNCEWANIDNVEMHAKVDIPRIVTYGCDYDKEKNIKMAHFDIDTSKVDMERYIQINKFNKLESETQVEFDDLLKTTSNISALIASSDLYYKVGSKDGERYQNLLNNTTGRLWVFIEYKD